MNYFNTVAQKASAQILHTTKKILSGGVKNSAKVATTHAKLAMDPKKINARLVVLTVLVDRHLIESQLLENVVALIKWQK
jgi:hypothetical protein